MAVVLVAGALAHTEGAARCSPPGFGESGESVQAEGRGSLLVHQAEAERIEMIQRVAPSVVCIFDAFQRGGGSGVLIDPEGYGLTNYHVVAGLLDQRRGWGGLADGVLYELEVLGIDVTGDVAMFRLIPPKPEFRFPFAKVGDSGRVQVGDTAIAMGNPFALSEDYTPSISMGIVTGVHRYQWGVRGNLVYSDCIQVDAPINPGNSGGPLFNALGEVIGINGRISVNTRGRFNVGFGYAISVNQIKRFMPALRAGLLAKHGTWQATVIDAPTEDFDPSKSSNSGIFEPSNSFRVRFAEVAPHGPAYQAGLRPGDGLLAIDGVPIQSANQVASILGTYPADWPIVVTAQSGNTIRDDVVRLEAIEPHLRKPFEVIQAVNQRAVRDVVRAFRRAVLGDAPALQRVRWTCEREYEPEHDGPTRPGERFDASMSLDDGLFLRQHFDDGTPGRVIEVSAFGAVERLSGDETSSDLTPAARLVLQAQYAMLQWLLNPADSLDVSGAEHLGADAARLPRDEVTTRQGVVRQRMHPRILEVIRVPLSETTDMRYAFDTQSHLLRRIEIEDQREGVDALVELRDYREDGGALLPHVVEVSAGDLAYCETRTAWSLSPSPRGPGFIDTREATSVGLQRATHTRAGFGQAIAKVLPRVVKLYGLRGGRQPGYGTGVLVSPDGLVLTVFSLLIDAENIRAVTADGARYDAHVVDRDFQRQLALLQLEGAGAPQRVEAGIEGKQERRGEARTGSEDDVHPSTIDHRPSTFDLAEADMPFFDLTKEARLKPGYWVLAAGNSFKVAEGNEPVSLVHGVFSTRTRLDARRRRMDFPYRGDVLVIDAITSNPGAPGSAVVNLEGEFVGMVGREVTSNLTHTHFNYAVPRDVLNAYVEERLARRGGQTRGGVTAGVSPAESDQASRGHKPARSPLDLRVWDRRSADSSDERDTPDLGIRMSRFGYKQILPLVERVVSGSAAEKAGLREGDLILSVNGRSVSDLSAFESRMQGLGPGEAVDLIIRRGRTIVSVHIEPPDPMAQDDEAEPVGRVQPGEGSQE